MKSVTAMFIALIFNCFAMVDVSAEQLSYCWSNSPGCHSRPLTESDTRVTLSKGRMINIEDLSSGITKPQRVIIENNGIQLRAIFKSHSTRIDMRSGLPIAIQANKSDRYQYEMAAYILAKEIGIDLIPMTIVRDISGKPGAVQLWVEDALVHKDVLAKNIDVNANCQFGKQIAVMNLFDSLIHNRDRNSGNILYTLTDCRLWLIDHSRAFSTQRELPKRLQSREVKISDELAANLMALNAKTLKRVLGKYLLKSQRRAVLKRRDIILSKWKASNQ